MDVAIVGAGAAAACLVDALSRQESEPGRLTVFDPSPQPWRGQPYARDLEQVRVNLPPQQMSARHGDDAHFADWLRSRPKDAARHLDPQLNQPLPPRAVYGDYLEETAEAAIGTLRGRGWQVQLIAERVTGAETRPGARVELHTAGGAKHRVDRAVLCVGAGSPRDVYRLAGTPGFVLDPYPLADTLDGIAADADVAVVGSGLTAVDVAVCLAAREHRGRITLLSRHGLLPHVQQRGFPFQPKHLSRARLLELAEQGQLTLHQLKPLFGAELAEFGEDPEQLAAEIGAAWTEHPAERLRRQLGEVGSEQRARRVLVRLVRSLGPLALGLLPERERKELQETHFRIVSSLCSPMVPVNAATLLALHDAGQLELVEGVERIEPALGGGFGIEATGRARLSADVVVNAVNATPYATPDCAEGLVRSLVEAGAAELGGTGGLGIEPGTGRLVVDGRPDPRLLALGDIAGHSLFITSSIAGLVAQTPAVTEALLSGF